MGTLSKPAFILRLRADEMRGRILAALAQSARRGRELAQRLRRPQNLVSYHRRKLLKDSLITEPRSCLLPVNGRKPGEGSNQRPATGSGQRRSR